MTRQELDLLSEMLQGAKVDRLLRTGQLSERSKLRLPPSQARVPVDPNFQANLNQARAMSAIEHLRGDFEIPIRLSKAHETKIGRVDLLGTKAKIHADPKTRVYQGDKTKPLGQTRMSTGRIKIYAYPVVRQSMVHDIPAGTVLRGTYGHELGERAVAQGGRPFIPNAQHLGVDPIVNELYEMSARNPWVGWKDKSLLLKDKALMSYGGEDVLKAWKRVGGTPSSPVVPNSRRYEALLRVLRKDLAEVEPPPWTLQQDITSRFWNGDLAKPPDATYLIDFEGRKHKFLP